MDRLWYEAGNRLCHELDYQETFGNEKTSVSSDMPWVTACDALATTRISSKGFRSLREVKSVVETVGISDARFYVNRIREWEPNFLDHETVIRIDDWGDPIRCPGFLLRRKRSFSPTTLRYLATAIWLKRAGILKQGTRIVEIGVGFGGLAAMNAVVSNAITEMVDLQQVVITAISMMSECGLASHAVLAPAIHEERIPLLISNYAFTELTSETQNVYMERYLKKAERGVIFSNAGVFSQSIHGRNDQQLIDWLNDAGILATMDEECAIVSPIDRLCRVKVIRW